MEADVLVLHHDALRLRQRRRGVELLGQVQRRRRQAGAELGLLAVLGNRQAVGRADVDTGVALDAQVGREMRLHVAVEAAFDFTGRLLGREAQLHLDVQRLEAGLEVGVHHLLALDGIVVVAVLPVVHPELGAGEGHPHRRAIVNREALHVLVNRDGGLVSVFDGPDDVLGPPGRVPAEEDAGACRHERFLVDDGHVPLVELEARVALDPGEGVLLADGQDDVIAGEDDGVDDLTLLLSAFLVPSQPLELHTGQAAALDDEPLRGMVLDDVDLLFLGILELPRRGLEVLARAARHDLHVLAAQALRRAAAVHGRVADTDNEDLFADPVDVAEVDVCQPFDADVDAVGLVTAGDVELLPLRRAAADEHRIEPFAEQRLHARDGRVVAHLDAHVEDHVHFLVEHHGRQAEGRDVDPHQATRRGVLLEDHAFIA